MRILFFILSLTAFAASADTLTLKNGDHLSGTIVKMEGPELIFNTQYAGDIKIKWAEVSSLKTSKPIAITLKDNSEINNASLSPAANTSARVTSDQLATPVKIELAKVKYINPSDATKGKGVKIKGNVNAGLSIVRGNSETDAYNILAEVIIRSVANRFTVGGSIYKSSDNNGDIEDRQAASFKYDHFLSKKRYVYGNTTFNKDKFKDQKLKSSIGVGYGHQFFETDTRNLALEAGINIVNDDFIVAADENYAAGRWALRYDQKFYNKKLEFFHQHEGLIDFEDSKNLVITSQTGFRFPVFSGMNASIQLNVDWDKSPPAGTKSTDRKLLFNLGYSW